MAGPVPATQVFSDRSTGFYSTLTGDERYLDKVVRSRKILIVTKREGAWRVGWGQKTRLADTTPD